jgi:hypothetical protein
VGARARWIPLLEIAVLVGGLAVVNRLFWPSDPGLSRVAPHPILFLALLMVARYGLGAGVLTAFAGAAEHLAMRGSLSLSAPIIQLVPTTVFVGMLVQRHIDRGRAASAGAQAANEEVARLGAELGALRNVNIELGERIVYAETTPALLFSHVKALYALELGDLNDNLLRLMSELLRVEAASIWWHDERGGARLAASVGPRRSEPLRLPATAERAFDRDVLVGADLLPSERPQGFPLLVGRLRAGESGPIIGYLTLDELSLRSSVDALRMFRMLVHWMSIAIGNALAFQRLEAHPTAIRVRR